MVVNELGVPDLLAKNGPMTGAQLAEATGAHREYLERVLRAASRMGLVRATRARGAPAAAAAASTGDASVRRAAAAERGSRDGGGRRAASRRGQFDLEGVAYDLTPLSAVLCSSHPNSVGAMVSLFWDHYGAAGRLLDGVRGGGTPYELWSGGKGHWDHMAEVPELQARFNRWARLA
jgi:hypothetical protein